MSKIEETPGHYIVDLTEDTYPITEALWWSYQHEYCHNYGSLEESTGKSKDEIKKFLEILKKLELVKYVRGLRNEEGEAAGSGFWVNGLGAQQTLELALYRYNYNDRPFGKSEGYVPKSLEVGGYKYRLVEVS